MHQKKKAVQVYFGSLSIAISLAWIMYWEFKIQVNEQSLLEEDSGVQMQYWEAPCLVRTISIKWWDRCNISKCKKEALIKSLTGLEMVPAPVPNQAQASSSTNSKRQILLKKQKELEQELAALETSGGSHFDNESVNQCLVGYAQDPYEGIDDLSLSDTETQQTQHFKQVISRKIRTQTRGTQCGHY